MVRQEAHQGTVVDTFGRMEASVQALVHELTPAQLASPSGCTGWRVRDVVAHIIGDQTRAIHVAIPRALAGDLTPAPDVVPGEVGRQTRDANARDTTTLHERSADELRELLDRTIAQSLTILGGLSPADLARPCWTVFTPRPIAIADVVRGYTAELWAHERWDIRRALGDRRPADPVLLGAQAEGLVRLLPALVIPEKARHWDAVVGLSLRGDGGGEWSVHVDHGRVEVAGGRPAKAATRLSMDPETFARVSWKRDHALKAALQGRARLTGNPLVGLRFGSLFPTY